MLHIHNVRLSDASGKLQFTAVHEGGKPPKSKFDSNDVFLLVCSVDHIVISDQDSGIEIFVWIGKHASHEERANGIVFAGTYLKNYKRPETTPISVIMEGGENEASIITAAVLLLGV